MAESLKVEKEDNLEDSLSSEDWTIIYKKESKANSICGEKTENETSNDCKENIDNEDSCLSKENYKEKIENVEVGEEAGEKETESDDVSILSDESEPEQISYEGRIERIDWQVERQHSSQPEISSNSLSDGTITSSALITCSVVALILGIIIAGQIVEFRGDEPSYSINNEIQEKLKELIGIKEKLNELNDVKHALDQIQVNMPEMKKLKDQLKYQKYEKKKFKYSIEDLKNFEKLNTENILNLNSYDNRLEMLEATYQNFCSTIVKIKSADSIIENELCKTPKILSDMITFKKNLKQAFEKTQETTSPEKRILVDVERKLDFASESLLFELKTVFSKFSMKIQERLNKLGYEMHNRLCFLYSSGKINDKFLNILLDKNYFLNNCNESNSDSVIINFKTNTTQKDGKNYDLKKKSYEEFKKNNYKYDYKNVKDYKKIYNSKENDYNEKLYDNENIDTKIKGEVKSDHWKKNKNENKERYSQEEKKYNKYEKFDNYKNEYKKSKSKHDINSSSENNKREYDSNKKFENNKIELDNDNKYENGKVEHDYNKKFDNKKDYEFYYEADQKKSNDFGNKRNYEYEYNEDDSKFIINLENYSDEFIRFDKEKPRHKNEKEYVLKLENFKDSKYVKYQGNEYRDKKDKYQSNGDWQMQRGKAREKLRNSDWYFVRADSRQKARIDEDGEQEIWSSRRPHKKSQGKSESHFRKKK